MTKLTGLHRTPRTNGPLFFRVNDMDSSESGDPTWNRGTERQQRRWIAAIILLPIALFGVVMFLEDTSIREIGFGPVITVCVSAWILGFSLYVGITSLRAARRAERINSVSNAPSRNLPEWPIWLVVAGFVIALADMPYGYYTLLRLIVSSVCVWLVFQLRPGFDGIQWVLGALAVLYNPLIPVYLQEKGLWFVVNVASAAVIFTALRKARTKQLGLEVTGTASKNSGSERDKI